MGLLTRLARTFFLSGLSVLTCSELEIQQESDKDGNDNNNNQDATPNNAATGQLAERGSLSRWVQLVSVVFDLLDLFNFVFDMIFAIRLFQLPDSIAYAALLLAGALLGRLVVFRATTVMFRGGIDWAPLGLQFPTNPTKTSKRLRSCIACSLVRRQSFCWKIILPWSSMLIGP